MVMPSMASSSWSQQHLTRSCTRFRCPPLMSSSSLIKGRRSHHRSHHHHHHHHHARYTSSCQCASSQEGVSIETSPATTSQSSSSSSAGGGRRYKVSLKRPLGLVLEENTSTKRIYVADIVEESNAEGKVQVGSTLISTSAIVYGKTSDYGGVSVRSGEQKVTLAVTGETFDTVMAAIGTHVSNMEVDMEFEAPDSDECADEY
ncbi:PDZ domain-containing protein [Pycnococcus provasolii]